MKATDARSAPADRADRTKDRHKGRKSVAVIPTLYAQMAELARDHDRPILWEFRRAVVEHLRRHGIEPEFPEEDEVASVG